MSLRVVISAGEVSGDKHLAKVLTALSQLSPGVQIRGMAGRECQQAGAHLDIDCYRSGATMGFAEVVRSAGKIFGSYRAMSALIREWKPQVVILVDYPDFNLRLAKVAHRAGCKVLYYIPPKVWAWRAGRVETIKRCIDCVATIFPFERPFFEERGYARVRYVGHPLGDRVGGGSVDRSNTLLMLPGSRSFEVERLMPPMLRVFEKLRSTRPDLRGKVVVAPNIAIEDLAALARRVVSKDTAQAVSWCRGDAIEAMKSARAGILKSGTCNLEGAVAGLPFVSVYSGSWVSKVITSTLVPLTEFSPVNIMKPGTVKEVFGVTIDESRLEREVQCILDAGAERERMIEAFRDIQRDLQRCDEGFAGASVAHRVASLVLGLAGSAHGSGGKG